MTKSMSICEKCEKWNNKQRGNTFAIEGIIKACTVNGIKRHCSFNDKPAIIYEHGDMIWCLNERYHRLDGPAVYRSNGTKRWYLNDQLHRLDGPAVEYPNGTKYWFLNGLPAIQIKNQEIIVGKPIGIDDDIGTVLRHIEGCFYEILFGNKKELVVRV